jgi:glycosyltransferase involved in cell wall biosynthesis
VYSTTGVDAYPFWCRYREVFDRVVVAARTGVTDDVAGLRGVDGMGVTVAPLPFYLGPWGFLRARRALRSALRDAIAGADALCLRAPGPIAGLAWRLRAGRPFAVEVVGDPRDALARGAVRSLARPFARARLARDLRAICRQAVAVAYVTTGALQRRYAAAGWSTAYSSIDLGDDAFAHEDDVRRRFADQALASRGTAADPWRVVFVGSLANRHKGLDVAIDALARCRREGTHVALTVLGDGIERRGLEERARALGLGEGIRFLGQLPAGRAVRSVLEASDLFVLPSRTEGLPRAMLEAMAAGTPALASRVGGSTELLPEDRLLPPGDARALGAAILRILAAPGTLLRLALEDLATARRYDVHRLRPRRVECYRRLRAALGP